MVDAGGAVARPLERHADHVAESGDRPVDAVAQADGLDRRRHLRQLPDVHRHRVGVVEQPGVRAHLAACPAAMPREHGEGPQRPEDPAHAEGVGDGLAEPERRGHLEVRAGRGDAADLDHVDHEVGAVERRAPVRRGRRWWGGRRAARRTWRAMPSAVLSRSGSMSCKRDGRVGQLGEAEEVGRAAGG